MLRNKKASKKINLIKEECACPLFKTYEALDSLEFDEVLEVITDDLSSATNTIPKFCKNYHCPVEITKEGELWKILIKKDIKFVNLKRVERNPILKLNGIAKRFKTKNGTVEALEPLNLSISQGEFICVVGPSGCGKSTLLSLIAGLERPDEGKILFNDREVDSPESDRVVIFQELALFPWLNVVKNVEFGLRMKNIKKEERRKKAKELLRLVHLSKFENNYIHELSGGMKQRVALARALAIDPQILLMDEPFTALDAQTRHLLHIELQELWLATQKTIIFVTHNVREAVSLADRIITMSASPGRIKKEYKIDLKRPRQDNDKNVSYVVEEIMVELKSEIDKVARREYVG